MVHCFNAGSEWSQCHMFCSVKHRAIMKCGKNTMLMKTQATSSTSKLGVTVRTGN